MLYPLSYGRVQGFSKDLQLPSSRSARGLTVTKPAHRRASVTVRGDIVPVGALSGLLTYVAQHATCGTAVFSTGQQPVSFSSRFRSRATVSMWPKQCTAESNMVRTTGSSTGASR